MFQILKIFQSRLFLKGRENDEPMTHQCDSSVHAQNSANLSAPMSSKQNYIGACKNNSEKARTFIQIGSVHVQVLISLT
jgi:hypothetical protein